MSDYEAALGESPESIMVVIDPTQETQPALERAIQTIQRLEKKVRVHIFIGMDSSDADTRATSWSVYRDMNWFNDLVSPIEKAGIEYTSAVSWSHQWQESILYTADYYQSQMIYLSDYAGNGRSFSNAGWALLRYATCPVLIVRDGAEQNRKSVLAAVNTQSHDQVYKELAEKVIAVTQWIANAYGADMHLVNAYNDSLHFPDRSKLLRETKLPNERVHILQGSPEDVIAETANKIQADIVVIGTRNRRGISAMMRGNTSEKVISRVRQDIITLN